MIKSIKSAFNDPSSHINRKPFSTIAYSAGAVMGSSFLAFGFLAGVPLIFAGIGAACILPGIGFDIAERRMLKSDRATVDTFS